MILGQRERHSVCDPTLIVGKRCTCAPGCSRNVIGDGEVDCDPDCVPCTTLAGGPLERRR